MIRKALEIKFISRILNLIELFAWQVKKYKYKNGKAAFFGLLLPPMAV